MKHVFLIVMVAAMFSFCGNSEQDKAISDAKQVTSELKKLQPGEIPTTESGWTMTAKINGKEWKAISIFPPDQAGRIVGDDGSERSIGLPYNRRNMVVGEKEIFSHDNAVDLMLPADEGSILGGYKGEMEITKANDNWAEGKFYFTGSSERSNKVVEVTDGFFRISLVQPQK